MASENKIFVFESSIDEFDYKCHRVIIVAASDRNVAIEYVKEKIGIDVNPTWLMGASYQTIYNQLGTEPINPQVKILSNNRFISR